LLDGLEVTRRWRGIEARRSDRRTRIIGTTETTEVVDCVLAQVRDGRRAHQAVRRGRFASAPHRPAAESGWRRARREHGHLDSSDAQRDDVAAGCTSFCDGARLRELVAKEPRIVRRRLALDCEARRRQADDHLSGGGGSGPLLRVDRRPEEGDRRTSLAATIHAQARAQSVVEGQPRQGRGVDPSRSDAAEWDGRDRAGQIRRALARGLRRSANCCRPD